MKDFAADSGDDATIGQKPVRAVRHATVRKRMEPPGSEPASPETRPVDFAEFSEVVKARLTAGYSVSILGNTKIARRLVEALRKHDLAQGVDAIYTAERSDGTSVRGVAVRPISALAEAHLETLAVAEDERKEDLLAAAIPFVTGYPKVILLGYKHFGFRDERFHHLNEGLEIPSLANGYPNCLIHLYQCLNNAAALDLRGFVAELGMFRGGTTKFLARTIEELGRDWSLIGFDTFDGFPSPRSLLDMYAHEDLCHNELTTAQNYLRGDNVEIVPGDIVRTCEYLREKPLVLTFFDTDNYSPARAALEIVREQTIIGGTIVFDHFTGVDRFKYTLGERMAAQSLIGDPRYFNLHGTGVFIRLR